MTGRCGDRKHRRIGPRQRDVLDTLARSSRPWSVRELVAELGSLNAQVVNRMLRGLHKNGLATRDLGDALFPRGRRPFLYSVTAVGLAVLEHSEEGKEVRL